MKGRVARAREVSLPLWLSREAIEIIHPNDLSDIAELDDPKDEDALEAGLALPLNTAGYGEDGLHVLAVAYLFGMVRNHPVSLSA